MNHIGSVVVSMLVLSAVVCGFKARSGQTKTYEICICCFSTKHVTIKRMIKDWLAQS